MAKRLTKSGLLIVLFLLFFTGISTAQQFIVSGVVKDSLTNKEMAGVNVIVKETTTGVITDSKGKYTLEVANPNVTLTFTFVGYETQEVPLNGRNQVDVTMVEKTTSMDEVVVVAYGSQKKKDLTGSVGVVTVDDAKKTATYDMAKMLQGKVAGVEMHGSGEPGGFVAMKIRGVSSFNNNNPLFVIDGVVTDNPFDFNPDDIESIQILKDASSSALYGSRAATGVVIITTKKGKAGGLKVDYSGYIASQRVPRKLSVMNSAQYQDIVNAADLNAGLPILPQNDPASPQYIDPNKVNTDWQKESFKTGMIQDHNLTFSGGNENSVYSVAISYFNQSATFQGPQNYDRYTINANTQSKKGIISYGSKVAYTQSHKIDYAYPHTHPNLGNSLTNLLQAIPTVTVYDTSRLGGYGGSHDLASTFINPVGVNNLITNWEDRNRFLGNVWSEIEPLKNLKYRINLSYDRTDGHIFFFEPTYDLGWYYTNNTAYMNQTRWETSSLNVENILTYALTVIRHKIDFLAGATYLDQKYSNMFGDATGFNKPYFPVFGNNTSTTLSSLLTENSLISYLGRINYNFDERYLLTFNLRRDGSSRFGPANRWGTFSSVAGAWNIHNEKFLTLPKFISQIKLRGGYGEIGNQVTSTTISANSDYLFSPTINPYAAYVFGNTVGSGSAQVDIFDTNIKWETKITSNVAIDLGFFNNSLTFTAEYYNNTSKDILLAIPLPLSAGTFNQGGTTVTTNGGTFNNQGFEFTADYKKVGKDYTYGIGANVSTLKNVVKKLGQIQGNNYPGIGSRTQVGHPVGELYGYVAEGIFNTPADIAAHATQINAAPGDIRFKTADPNNENNHAYIMSDANDQVFLGSAIPNLYFGLNLTGSFKSFDLTISFQGVSGNKVYNGVYQSLMSEQYTNASTDALKYWKSSTSNTNVPRPVINDPNRNDRFSTRFVEDGSYIKLQNAELGFNLPTKIMNKTHVIRTFRIYISGQNLLTMTKYRGMDPDFASDGLLSRGFDFGSFPNPRTILVGIKAGF